MPMGLPCFMMRYFFLPAGSTTPAKFRKKSRTEIGSMDIEGGFVSSHHVKESDFCQTIVRQVGDKKYPVGLRIFLWGEAHGPIFSKDDASVLCCWFGIALGRLNRDHIESALQSDVHIERSIF